MLVRISAKELTSLILDEERLRTERSDRRNWKTRVTGIDEFGPQSSSYGNDDIRAPPRHRPERRRQGTDEDDAEYRLALEASKYEAEEDKKRRAAGAQPPAQDDDLAKAIKLSKEEEELRRRELEESNAASLFDDTPTTYQQQPQNTGFNQGYQQQGAVDWFGNPVEQQQQPQTTGYLNNAYSQPTGFQPQQTGFQNGFQQPQQTGFDQLQQQQPIYLQQQSTIQPQQTAFDNLNNPYGQQQNQFGQSQQQQQQVTSPGPQPGTQSPWATNQQSADVQKPMQTGSNNPFATHRPITAHQQTSPPSLNSIAEQKTAQPFNNQSSFNPIANYQPPQQQPPQQKPQNAQNERLNALLASGEGMDTFGNTGDLRIPAQHTAPGTFINSSGQGLSRLPANQTGNNPFFSQHSTGAPQQHIQSPGPFGAPQQFPAQTGPAGMFGQPNNNPFGGRQQQGQGQGGSLIDL